MAKQILISQNDFGILFNVTILNEDKSPVVFESDTVNVYIVKPDGTKTMVEQVDIIDNAGGVIEFELKPNHTDITGNYSIYIEIGSPLYEITTVLAENYYVMPEHGGY